MGVSVFEPINDQVLVRPDVVVDDGPVVRAGGRRRGLGLSGVVFLVGPQVGDVRPGDKVLYPEEVGAEVKIGDMGYVALPERDLLMVM